MQRAIVLAVFLGLSVGVLGNECSPGYTHKKDLATKGLMCIDAAKDPASCNSECCEKNVKACGGLTVTCAFDRYAGYDAAWKNKAATKKTANTACCSPRAKCSSSLYKCPAGYKKKTSNAAMLCNSDAASCTANAFCCEKDIATCGGVTAPTCPPASTYLPGAAGKPKATDTWKKKAAGTGGAIVTNCCVTIAKCTLAAYTVPAGYKKKAGMANTVKCKTDAASCAKTAPGDCDANGCCVEADALTCGGIGGVACTDPASYAPVTDVWKKKACTAGNKNTVCCTKKATCKGAVCPSGYKKKKGVDAQQCTGDVASCTKGTALLNCCEADTTKCGGLGAISCKYGFFDESSTWVKATTQAVKDTWNNKAADSKNKNVNCCTPREICKVPPAIVGTTTPAPVVAVAAAVTTTPAAPARKFSEHQIAAQEQPWSGNMVWLGVGGVIGMGVLMVVQGLRKRTQSAAPLE